MTLSMFVKREVDFRHVEIWLWILSWEKNLALDMTKYDFEYVCQRKSWLYICLNRTLNMFVKGKFNFRHIQIWHWVCLSKGRLTSNTSKYNFEYVCQRKSWLEMCPNMTLSMFVKGKVDFRHV
jgi:hypothetical protein